MDHGRHQAQYAARALELHQGRPVAIEPVEDLRVDGIGRLQALLVIGGAAFRRELVGLRTIEIGEGACHEIALLELFAGQPAPGSPAPSGTGTGGRPDGPEPGSPVPPPAGAKTLRRFHGTVRVDASRVGRDANPRLSSLVSEIDGIKKRHGLLIERALIFAINKLPNWYAAKERIAVAGGKHLAKRLVCAGRRRLRGTRAIVLRIRLAGASRRASKTGREPGHKVRSRCPPPDRLRIRNTQNYAPYLLVLSKT
jgi:hypothetical protein